MSTIKKVEFGTTAMAGLNAGINILAEAVSETLGPKGRNVIIDNEYGIPSITKDGITVAESISFKDPLQNMGANLIKTASRKANAEAGDGSSTTIVLARAILKEGLINTAAGSSPIEIKRGIDFATQKVVEALASNATEISYDGDEVEQVATISANNEPEIGKLIADAVAEVGKDGSVMMGKSLTTKTYVEITEGVQLGRGFASPYFVTDEPTMVSEMNNCSVLIYKGKISIGMQLAPLLTPIFDHKQSVLIIAESIEGEALQSLVANKVQRGIKVCAVNAPGFGYNRDSILEDIAMSVGATVIDPGKAMNIEDPNLSTCLGMAGKVIVTRDKTIIEGGDKNENQVIERQSQLNKLIEKEENPQEKLLYQTRLIRLNGKIATIKVGASSEVELGEKRDRIEDALNATNAAMEEGIVSGGGLALVEAGAVLGGSFNMHPEIQLGVDILMRSLSAPMKQIADNAGVDGAVVVAECNRTELGYNAKTDTYEDLILNGVIDPVKVTRIALENAASVAGMILTTSVTVTRELE